MATRRRRPEHVGSSDTSPESSILPEEENIVAGEEIADFEEAEVAEDESLPLRVGDMPAPLLVRRAALTDEVDDFDKLLEELTAEEKDDLNSGNEDLTEESLTLDDDVGHDDGEVVLDKEADGGADIESEESDNEETNEVSEDNTGDEVSTEPEVASFKLSDPSTSLDEDEGFWNKLAERPEDDEDPPSLSNGRTSHPLPFARRKEPEPMSDEALNRAKKAHSETSEASFEAPAEEEGLPLPLAVDEGTLESKGWQPALCVAARQAAFAGPKEVSLISSEKSRDRNEDKFDHVLAAFSDLEPGQKGFVRISLRAYPEFKAESRAWLQARRLGQDPSEARKKGYQGLVAWVKYFLALLWYEANKTQPHALGGKVPPVQPGGGGGNIKPLSSRDAGIEEAQAWKDAEQKVLSTPHYEADVRIGVVGRHEDAEHLERVAEEVAAGFDAYTTTHQEIIWGPADSYDAVIGCMGVRREPERILVLSAGEVGELARVLDDRAHPHGVLVKHSYFKEMPLPNPLIIDDPNNPRPGLIPLGITNPRSEDAVVFGMRVNELDCHAYITGATGTGKSEFLKHVIFGVAKANYPLVVIDPHGQLSDDTLNGLIIGCPERINDIVLCDLSDPSWPVALNPLDVHRHEEIEPTVASIMEMLERQMHLGQAGAPRAVVFAQQALSALCEANIKIKDPDTKCTLLHVPSFFIDPEFRRLVMEFCSNPTIREAFDPDHGPFESATEKQQSNLAMPIIRAFQPLGSSESFSAVFASGENRLDFGQLIAERKIVLVKLASFTHQKKLGEFVGALILPWLLSTMDAWGRKKDPETGRSYGVGCRVFVDEAPALIGPKSSAIELLAQSRKWDLGLITVSQYPSQFDKEVLEALLANTKSKFCLTLDPSEAGFLAKSIAGADGRVTAGDIADLPNFHYYGNILLPTSEGASNSGAFSAACLAPLECTLTPDTKKLRDDVIKRSHTLVCNRKEDIAEKRAQMLESIKVALTQQLTEHAEEDGGHLPYKMSLDPFDPDKGFDGW